MMQKINYFLTVVFVTTAFLYATGCHSPERHIATIPSTKTPSTHHSHPSVSGEWLVIQSNGYTGQMTLKQSHGMVTGQILWDNHIPATLNGTLDGNKLSLLADYLQGLQGHYTATLNKNRSKLLNGISASNQGPSATWEAVKK